MPCPTSYNLLQTFDEEKNKTIYLLRFCEEETKLN